MIRMQTPPHLIWKTELINIATTAGAIKEKLKNLDNLDCVAVYCRSDPTKQGAIETEKVVTMLENKIKDLKNFSSTSTTGKIRLKQT